MSDDNWTGWNPPEKPWTGWPGRDQYDLDEGAAMRRPVQVAYNRSLPYAEFLKSLYWEYVRKMVFRMRGRHGWACAHCRTGDGRLDVHHKTYEHRGDEFNHLDDLIILCGECHAREHGRPAPA